MKYNKQETINHPLSSEYSCCLTEFDEVVKSEDSSLNHTPNILSDTMVINLDCTEYERYHLSRDITRDKTMDITFAISDETKSEMLLVEFKLNMKNPNNLNQEDLKGKVDGSKNILNNSIIHDRYIFILKPDRIEQGRNRLQRMIPKFPNNYIIMDLNTLINSYF